MKKRLLLATVCFAAGFTAAFLLGFQAPVNPPENARGASDITANLTFMLQDHKPYPLTGIVEGLAGYKVADWNGEEKEALITAARRTRQTVNVDGIRDRRVNEVGNDIEDFIQTALQEQGFKVTTPLTRSGKHRSTGYPDLEAFKDGKTYYIEVKTYNPKNVNTTQRSFYLSPSTDPKITKEAFHLLVAFAMKKDASGTYRVAGSKWLDLHDLRCKLKFEFNASNRDLYNPESGLVFFEEHGL